MTSAMIAFAMLISFSAHGQAETTEDSLGGGDYELGFTLGSLLPDQIKGVTEIMGLGGVRGGMTYGTTDEYGIDIVENDCHVHDYHATILHLLGIDHERLTYRYAGRDFRLTDVAGRVLNDIIA